VGAVVCEVLDCRDEREIRAFSASRPTLYFEVSLRADMFVMSVKCSDGSAMSRSGKDCEKKWSSRQEKYCRM
jgi:hypothetical protein